MLPPIMSRPRTVLAAAAAALVTATCAYGAAGAATAAARPLAQKSPSSSPTIVVGSTNFTEQVIVATLYSDVLRHAGYKTQLKTDLGTRLAVEPALAHGALDLYPEYAGSLLVYLKPADTALATRLSTDLPALKAALAPQGATVLNPAPAVDVNVFAVTKKTADRYHLTTLSSLAPVAPKLTFAAPSECPKYAYCLLGLEHLYHIHFKSFLGVESEPTTAAYLRFNKVQVAEFFSSDGTVLENGFVQLQDDKHLQPADHLVPLIRKSVATPGVKKALNALSAKLTTQQLERLNIDVNDKHQNAGAVAAQWLRSQHLT
jgi:osmoprotectant transport system substrate-binding protein